MTSRSPFFSIIIPLYNKQKFIANTLQRVFAQSFENFEILIINDGSTDKSVEILAELKDERIKIYHQENQGVSAARNKGIELASGEFICFLDADDVWNPDFLNEIHKLITRFPDYRAFAAAIEMEACGTVIPAKYSVKKEVEAGVYIEDYFEASKLFSVLWTSSSAFHRSVFDKVGNFDVTIKSGQDTDLWIRIGEHFKVVFTTKILAKYTQDQRSLSRSDQFKKETKIRYEKFKTLEKNNLEVKYFMDLNRFSEVITLRLQGNLALAKTLQNDISVKGLPLKKQILLQLPPNILQLLVTVQPLLIRLGLRKTYYK